MSQGEPIIYIPTQAGDQPSLWYLSLASPHPFTIEDQSWPTVEHYILAKMFEGTILEDEIREAKTVTIARMMARPRSHTYSKGGQTFRKVVYGANGQYCPRDDWNKVGLAYVKRALEAKFAQNSKIRSKLSGLQGFRLIDKINPEVGPIIEGIRDSLTCDKRSILPSFSNPKADVRPDTNQPKAPSAAVVTIEEDHLIKSIIKVTFWIRDLEGVEKVYAEMFEDSLYNFLIVGEKSIDVSMANKVPLMIKTWIKEIVNSWSAVLDRMPKFEMLVRDVEKRVSEAKMGMEARENVQVSIFIAATIRWLRMDALANEKDVLLNRSKTLKSHQIILPPVPRSYRKGAPSKLQKAKKGESGEATDIPGVNITITQRGSTSLRLRGESIPRYRSRLTSLGGTFDGPKTVIIHKDRLDDVEKFIFNDLPVNKRYQMAYGLWAKKKVELLIDTARRVSELLGVTELTDQAFETTIYQIYNFPHRPPLIPPFESPTVSSLSKKVQGMLPITGPESFLNKPDLTYRQFIDYLDGVCGWRRKPLKIVSTSSKRLGFASTQNLTMDRIGLIKAINHLSKVVNGEEQPKVAEEQPKVEGLDIVRWSFLTLCPKEIRHLAERYIDEIMEDVPDGLTIEQLKQYLEADGIFSRLEEIVDLTDDPLSSAIFITFYEAREAQEKMMFDIKACLMMSKPTSFEEVRKTDVVASEQSEEKSAKTSERSEEFPERSPKDEDEVLDDARFIEEIDRGCLYISILRHLNLDPETHSKTVDKLERMDSVAREIWIKSFSSTKEKDQRTLLNKLYEAKSSGIKKTSSGTRGLGD